MSRQQLEEPDRRLRCFQHELARECRCKGHRFATLEHVLEQATHGGATCSKCHVRSDLRKALEHFNVLGRPEKLFGVDVYHLHKKIPATQGHQILIVDPGVLLPYDAEIIYANVSPQCREFDEAPSLLAPQEMHRSWPLHMRFHVPPGPERAISMLLAVRPKDGLPYSIEVVLQAVDAFHRYKFGLAALLLASAIEAILRPLCESLYATRGVQFPRDLAFASLVERARLLFEPQLGAQITGYLKALAKEGRNPHAHGIKSELKREDVAMWMVDVATLYEWSQIARPIHMSSSAAPPNAAPGIAPSSAQSFPDAQDEEAV